MKNTFKKLFSITLAVLLFVPALSGCKKKTVYDNEKDPLVLSTQDLDGVFNPFFATSGPDMGVIGMTQLSMLGIDKGGQIVANANEPTIALDYTDTPPDSSISETDKERYNTTYEFLIKNDIKFSDGSPLTMKDILFNFYVYLDPLYTGSTTMHSTDIKGLKAYRAQTLDESSYKDAEAAFYEDGNARLSNLIAWANDEISSSDQIEKDLKKTKELFKEELYADWSVASGMFEETTKEHPELTHVWHVYMWLQGIIEIKEEKGKDKQYIWGVPKEQFNNLNDAQAKEACVKMVYDDQITDAETGNPDYFKDNIAFILYARPTRQSALNYFIADEKSKYFDNIRAQNPDNALEVANISGITTRKTKTFDGVTYETEHDVLTIVINGIDPKAIYNFSIPVVPMKYYTSAALYNSADPSKDKFGVEFGSMEFMFETVRAQRVPMGAGPYAASNGSGALNSGNVNDFYSSNVVYFVRNDHFLLGPAKIRLLKMQVITSTQLLNAVSEGDVYTSEPNATKENIEAIDKNKNLKALPIDNLGYGYIGLNAKYIPDIDVRKAIMHAMNTQLALEYYTNDMASAIHRPMSSVSYYYPSGATSRYPYDSTGTTSWNLLKNKYWKGTDGILTDGTNKLIYTFTIAGDTSDHPIWDTFMKAKEILDGLGFRITVNKDANALRKLSSGLLTVWAAAWSSTIDPDMYQVYHKDSNASSILNWGLKEMLNGNNSTEKALINGLAKDIEDGRKFLDKDVRKPIYARAMEKVMDLAIELPTYQRKNLYVFNTSKIDISTIDMNATAYEGPMGRIWEVSLVTK